MAYYKDAVAVRPIFTGKAGNKFEKLEIRMRSQRLFKRLVIIYHLEKIHRMSLKALVLMLSVFLFISRNRLFYNNFFYRNMRRFARFGTICTI